ncbi:MAG: gamma carbonic anhydrase family protein [Candidatus Phosphoribacter sp.]
MLVPFGPHSPQVAPDAWVAPTATLIGDVIVESGASIWYGAVLRADRERIRIGARSNIQDNAVVHADPGKPADVGQRVTVGHGAIVHGCSVGDDSLVGMGATVLNDARIGSGSLVAAGSVVREGQVVPPHSLVAGVPAVVRCALPADFAARAEQAVLTYERLREEHRAACP